MKKIMKNMVCMLLCAIMALSVITIPEKVTAKTTTKNTLYRYMDAKSEKYGFVNSKGKIVVKAVYDEADNFSDGMALVRKGSKYGFVNTKGEIAIPLKYKWAEDFSDGLTSVLTSKGYIFINKQGKQVFDTCYEMTYGFSDGLASVQIGDKFGYINTNGKTVIKAQYNWAYPFSEGRALVRLDSDTCAIINTKGKIFKKYDDRMFIEAYHKYSDGYMVYSKDGKTGALDKNGKIAIKPSADWHQLEDFSEGLAPYWNGLITEECGYGYINKKGKTVIKPVYGHAFPFSEGLACVQDNKTDKFGYINKKGKKVIGFKYDYALSFCDGLACVMKNGKSYMIDKKGKTITIK